MPLNCHGLHDWTNPYYDNVGEGEITVAVIRCLACGKKKTFIPMVDFIMPFEDEILSINQCAFR